MSIIDFTTGMVFNSAAALSYADLNQLRADTITLDAMSRRGRTAWLDQTYEFDDSGFNPSPLTSAAFRFRTGLTTLTIIAFGSNGNADAIRVYLNGVLAGTYSCTNADQTITLTLTGRGYGDGDVIEVYCDVTRTANTDPGTYAVRDMYVSPASAIMTWSWPGVPTFGAITSANLQQLANACQWLFDRMQAVPMPVPTGTLWRTLHGWPSTKLFWRGTIARGNGANRLFCTIAWTNINTASERMRLMIDPNGAGYGEVATTPTITAGQSGVHDFNVDLSGYTDEALLRVKLEQVVNTAFAGSRGALATRWNMRWVETSQSAWSYTTPAALSQARESITFATLQARLNAIGTALTTIYGRLTGSADVWNRIRPFRRHPTIDVYQREYFKLQYVARGRRFTDALWVKGKNVTLHWGAMSVKQEAHDAPFQWETEHKEQVCGGESYEDKYLYFDSFPGLVPGAFYYLTGDDVTYAAEVWS